MKTFTLILLFTVMIMPSLAQYDYHKQAFKVTRQNQVYLTLPLKSGIPTIKLDSVIAMNPSEDLHYPFTTPVKEFYEYDNNNRLSHITIKAWNESKKEYSILSKKGFLYDSEGRIGSIIFDEIAQSLKYSYDYTYDTTGKLIKFSRNFINGELNLSDLIFSYNDLGKLSDIKNFFETKDYRILNNTYIFSYNEAGNLSDFKFVFDDNVVAYQTFYEWDSENKLLTELFEDYIWGDKTKTEYSYSATGDRIKSSYFNWENLGWKLSGSDEYFYCDLNCSDLAELQNFAEYFYNPIEFKSTKLISNIAHYIGNTFIGKTEYFYSSATKGGTTGVNNLNIADVNVYPNPATDKITFTWNKNYNMLNLKLLQINGACVMDREISSGEKISVKNHQIGIYLYKLSNGNQVVKSGKIIVE